VKKAGALRRGPDGGFVQRGHDAACTAEAIKISNEKFQMKN
jgi:hypothetical protein